MGKVTDSDILLDGLSICLDRMTKIKDGSTIRNYLSFGSDDESTIKEKVARLLLIATTNPSNSSPIQDIIKKIMDGHIVDLDSSFFREYLESKERNKKNSFINSKFYKILSGKVYEIELKSDIDNMFYLNDILLLENGIRKLYIKNLDKNIFDDKLDVRNREILVELYQHNLDDAFDGLKNGVKRNVQVQTRHQ